LRPTHPEPYPTNPAAEVLVPDFGSPEHFEWIARRLARNVRFRREVEDAEREALREYQLRLRRSERRAS